MQSEATTTPAPAPGEGVARRRLLFALPAAAFAGLAGLFAMSLGRDPSRVPSALIGRPAPEFSLPPVQGRTLGLSKADLLGTVSLVNVFASWCVECRAEHPLLMRLAQEKTVPIHGLNYKDAPGDAVAMVNTMGDPYSRTGTRCSAGTAHRVLCDGHALARERRPQRVAMTVGRGVLAAM